MARDQELPPREQEVAESVPEVVSCCAGNSPRRPVQVPPRPVMPPPRHAEVPQRPAPARIDVPARLRAEPAPHVNGPLDVLGKALLACVILNAALAIVPAIPVLLGIVPMAVLGFILFFIDVVIQAQNGNRGFFSDKDFAALWMKGWWSLIETGAGYSFALGGVIYTWPVWNFVLMLDAAIMSFAVVVATGQAAKMGYRHVRGQS